MSDRCTKTPRDTWVTGFRGARALAAASVCFAAARGGLAQPVVGSDDAPNPGDEPAAEAPAAPLRPVEACEGSMQDQIRLSGTIYDPKRPERSFAILGKRSESGTAVYRSGARIGTLELLEVHPRAVLLDSEEGAPCWLRMTPVNRSTQPERPIAEQKKKKPRAKGNVFSKEELEQKVRKLGDGKYRVERSLLQRALESAPALARRTRTKVVQRGGAAVGVSLRRLPRDGLLSHLGFKRGDVIRTVNGISFGNLDGVLKARTQLTSAPRLSVALLRNGKPVTLEYQVE